MGKVRLNKEFGRATFLLNIYYYAPVANQEKATKDEFYCTLKQACIVVEASKNWTGGAAQTTGEYGPHKINNGNRQRLFMIFINECGPHCTVAPSHIDCSN